MCPRSEIDSDFDTDDTYNPSPGRTHDPDDSCTNTSSDDDSCVTSFISDDDSSVVSVEFEPFTPLHMPMMECRTRNLLRRSCFQLLWQTKALFSVTMANYGKLRHCFQLLRRAASSYNNSY